MKTVDRFEHYRWHEYNDKREPIRQMSWKETLRAMCRNYGTFCGRWHSNEFWKKTMEESISMTEEQCREKVIKTEHEADAELECWRQMQ